MVDNVPVTPGAGADIATDDVSGVHFQKVKLDLGADGASTPVVGSLPVNDDTTAGVLDDILTASQAIQASVAAIDIDTTTIIGHVDGLETAIASTNTKLDTVIGHVDGVETAIGTTNSTLTTIDGRVDGLEAASTAIQTAVEIMDDWDESDRAKVNPIVGQAGVQGASGAVSASTQRVVLATDVALPTGANAIGKLAANDGVDIGNVDVASITAGDNLIGRVKISDGTDVADVLDLTNSNPIATAIVDGAGTQITSFGGGTQYTEGDTDASVTGTAMLWEDAADTLRAVSAAKPLPIKLTDGTDVADILDLTNSNPLAVAITDGAGTQITSFGGGTQYTEGDTDASIAGTAMLWEDTSDTLRPVSVAKPLPIADAGGSLTVDNAGTFAVQPAPATSGGLSTFMASGADGSTALTNGGQAVKASAGQLYGWTIFNPNTVTSWVHFYNAGTGSVTVGTTNPQLTLAIPASSAAHVFNLHGIAFSTAITVAATSTVNTNAAPTTALDTAFFYA